MKFLLPFASSLLIACAYADDVGPDFDPADTEAYELEYGYYPWRTYETITQISPQLKAVQDSPECHDGLYTFVTPRGHSISDPGPAILDGNGDLVWVKSTPGQAYDFKVQDFKGGKYLSYWVGDDRVRGHGAGDYYVLDASYQEVFKVSAMNNLAADLHELLITPEGTALLTIYEVYMLEKEGLWVWDCLFQEIDIEKNELIFEWRASDHVGLDETYRDRGIGGTLDDPFDFYHINSVQKDDLGNYLISARYTHSITYINGTNGDTIWILGGKRNFFKDLSGGNATNFAWQHDARFHPLDTFPQLMAEDIKAYTRSGEHDGKTTQLVTLFDNSAEDQHYTNPISRGLLLEVTYPSVHGSAKRAEAKSGDLSKREAVQGTNDDYTVRLIKSYENPNKVVSSSQGNLQIIPSADVKADPKVLIGYGFNAVWTEYAADGKVLCDVHFASNYSWERGDVQSYRVFKFPWIAQPAEPPVAVLSKDGGVVYASWNGATEVRGWILQHSEDPERGEASWRDVVRVEKAGFETEVEYDEEVVLRYLRVKAVDANGKALGLSREVDLGWLMVSPPSRASTHWFSMLSR